MIGEAKPFLKWAGGKKQLLGEFEKRFSEELTTGKLNKFVEPFIGGGAVFFHVVQKFEFDECHIFDINEELILAYSVVKNDVDELIDILKPLESEYLPLDTEARKLFYYGMRDIYNANKSKIDYTKYGHDWVERAAHIIFLNRTCFNGLFRVNSKGGFNVPIGSYKNPSIVHENNLRNASHVLQNAQIHHGDFSDCKPFVDEHTFVYLDPPYRPLNKTSSFTSYSKDSFNDDDQIRLAQFYKKLDAKGAKLMLSNSDPKNEKPDDTFFDDIYSDFKIERAPAKRIINSNAAKRGAINELIITNYNMVVDECNDSTVKIQSNLDSWNHSADTPKICQN